MAEPPDLLDPQPIVLVERAYDEMWETINEVRRNDPPLWVRQQIDALISRRRVCHSVDAS